MKRLLFLFLLFAPVAVQGESVTSLARCSTAVFREIGRTGKWSGEAPAGCPPQVAVEREPSGLVVTVWGVEQGRDRWVETAFSAVMDYREVAAKKALALASKDIMKRAGRLERCLESLKMENDPLECRRKGSREYLVGEESGVEDRDSLWLDDGGRGCVVQYAIGDTSATPTPPLSFSGGEPLPPGVNIDIFLKNDRGGRR